MESSEGGFSPRGLFVGLTTVDLVQRVPAPPGPDEKVVSSRADVAAGGPAANAAVTFAALGGRASLLTAVGSAPVAGIAREDLARHGVEVRDAAPGHELAISAVTVTEATGERSVVSRNAGTTTPAVPADLGALVDAAHVVLLDGHHPALAVAAATAARQRRVPVVLDAGSWKPVLAELLPACTAVICSADFRLPGGLRPGPALLEGPRFLAVSAGGAPVRWWARQPGGRTTAGEVPVPRVRVRDTLGAGDVLHGAFAYALAAGRPELEALAHGVRVASLRVGHVGPRGWLSETPLPG